MHLEFRDVEVGDQQVDVTEVPLKVHLGSLSFGGFGYANWKRHAEWPTEPGIVAEPWTLSEWATAVAEETGELCGAIKRLNRFRKGYLIKRRNSRLESEAEGLKMIKHEIGDIITYLDLLAQSEGFTLEECVREAFNGVSEREGLPNRI